MRKYHFTNHEVCAVESVSLTKLGQIMTETTNHQLQWFVLMVTDTAWNIKKKNVHLKTNTKQPKA